MKRVQSTVPVATTIESSIMALPAEIFEKIHQYLVEQSLKVSDLLYWCATCQRLWSEYLEMDDKDVIEFCDKKKEENRLLLLASLCVDYKNNILQFMQFKHIVKNCASIKWRIASIAKSDLFDQDLPCSRQTGFCVQRCGLFDGISFRSASFYVETRGDTERRDDDDNTISDESMVILCSVAERILARYGWRLSLVFKRGNNLPSNVDLPCPSPWSIPSYADVYIR